MASLTKADVARAKTAMAQMNAFLQGVSENVDDDALALIDRIKGEHEKIQKANAAFVLAVIADEWAPLEMFKPWASSKRIQQWRDAGHLDVPTMHGRSVVKPSAFFKYFNSLPDERAE